ncbi:molybdopterin molybdotransferase MoeA [Sphingomonas elodea]|uniref:molybdopterin molybdotransferase MoeA n=1 Tax=Sphingomonas elodea TaxID=179878 RepID=UPI0002630529|nr:molybdopterin molybdotransferase MoeA [Sphingomonas elodea]
MALLPIAEAQARLLALAGRMPVERVPLAEAVGRWVAEPIAARRTQPESDLSAMDGYAIRFADLPGPWRVIGESAAGNGFDGTVAAGEAVRIFTGAPLPAGADSVLVQEEANRDGDALHLAGEGPRHVGRNTRRRGLDFFQNDVLIAPGERLTPARIALAAIAGHADIAVRRKVRVAIAATGDELVPPGEPVGPAQLPESNRMMLAAQFADLPVDIVDLGILPDDLVTLTNAFATVDADLLVTSGGASVGDHDLVRPALEAAGATIDFWRIALRPGKPMMAGRRGDMVVLGLPGNPVSVFVTALLFAKPMVAHLAGAANPFPTPRLVLLGEDLPANGPRTDYIRAVTLDGRVHPAAIQDSSMLRTLARSTCLIIREPHAAAANAFELVEILDIA